MCGIAGLFRPGGGGDGLLSGTVKHIAEVLAHRGPDASGLWTNPSAGVAFGHRRLSILDLSESPDAIAVNRITIAEAVRFPQLGDVFWRAGPEQTRTQIEAFLRRADEAGTLSVAEAKLAAEGFISLMRGDFHLRQLLRLDPPPKPAELRAAARAAVATFLRAFGK